METPDAGQPVPFENLRRYVPLACWVIPIVTVLFIALKIVGYGYLPGDDALRHAAKALTDKSWQEILVLGPAFQFDPNFGWHWFLHRIHLLTDWNAESLVVFCMAGLFLVNSGSVMACLKRPEAWLAVLTLMALVSDNSQRLLIGRPYVLSYTAVMIILLLWQRHGNAPIKWWTFVWITALIAIAVYLHGVWYLWVLPIAAFFLAQEFRWGFLLAGCWIAGTLIGASLTGHPVEDLKQAIVLAARAVGMHKTQSTLVTELKPTGGDIFTVLFIAGLLVVRQLAKLNLPPLHRSPAFWLALMCWILGSHTARFWADWGVPALMVLLLGDLQLLLQTRFVADSLQRLVLVGALAVTAYAVVTADVNSRWTYPLTKAYLTQDNPDLKGWFPDKDGILYSTDMGIFFDTFFKNPNGDWRYALGFESTLMTDDNFKVYYSALWNGGDMKAYKPWVEKMQPADRLVLRGTRNAPPGIPELDWNYGVTGIWIGRLPGHGSTNDAPITIRAMIARTNSIPAPANAVPSKP